MVTEKRKRPARLSASFVKNVSEAGRYGDGRGGHGLSLLVKPTKSGRWSKTWSQRLRIKGDIFTRGLGSYPRVSLAMAREIALDNASRVARGEDIREPARVVPTVREAFEKYIAVMSPQWSGKKTEDGWRRSLEYLGSMASMLVSDVTSSDVLRVIEPLWHKINVKAQNIRSHLSAVMRWAIVEGYLVTDPASKDVTRHLPKRGPVKHHRSLHYAEVGRAMAEVRDAHGASWVTKSVTIFVMLTVVRKSSALAATWEQFDLDAEVPVWHIPKTKNGEALDVPLPTQAVELLLFVQKRTGRSEGVVFPGRAKGGRVGEVSMNALMKRLGIDASPHGARSSFRNWAAENGQDPYVSEKVLGHAVSSAVLAAYLTTDFFDLRKPMMQKWADHIEETMGPVIGESW